MILKSFDFQCDFDFQISTSKMILILKSSAYDDFAHLCIYAYIHESKFISDPQNYIVYIVMIFRCAYT